MGRLPDKRTRSKRLRGHYIAFRKVGPNWLRFDDGVVHRVELRGQYNIYLAVYRRADRMAFHTTVDVSALPILQKSVILNRRNSEQEVASETPDPVGKPPLITKNDASSASTSTVERPIQPERPIRFQPYRKDKDFVVYYNVDSDSSDEEGRQNKANLDDDYVPPLKQGMKAPRIFLWNICFYFYELHIMMEYFCGILLSNTCNEYSCGIFMTHIQYEYLCHLCLTLKYFVADTP